VLRQAELLAQESEFGTGEMAFLRERAADPLCRPSTPESRADAYDDRSLLGDGRVSVTSHKSLSIH
jgi:hypothetical protein